MPSSPSNVIDVSSEDDFSVGKTSNNILSILVIRFPQKCVARVTVPPTDTEGVIDGLCPKILANTVPYDKPLLEALYSGTVTVSIDDTVSILKDLISSIPVVHKNLIKNNVHHLMLIAVKEHATVKVNQYISEFRVNSMKKPKYEDFDSDFDLDNAMYDESSEHGPSFDDNTLQINEGDLHRSI